jgi:hypothetical protein
MRRCLIVIQCWPCIDLEQALWRTSYLNLLFAASIPCPTQSFLLSNAVIGTYCRLYLVDINTIISILLVSITQLKLVPKGCPTKIGDRLERDGGVGLNKMFPWLRSAAPEPIVLATFVKLSGNFPISLSSPSALQACPSPSPAHKSLACSNAIILTPPPCSRQGISHGRDRSACNNSL